MICHSTIAYLLIGGIATCDGTIDERSGLRTDQVVNIGTVTFRVLGLMKTKSGAT